MIERSVPAHGFYFQWGVVCPSKKMFQELHKKIILKTSWKTGRFWKALNADIILQAYMV